MIRYFCLACFVFYFTDCLSQQLPHYSLYMFNDVLTNPSALSKKKQNELVIMSRNQWTGFNGAPTTQSISYNNISHPKYGRGINIINDNNKVNILKCLILDIKNIIIFIII